MRYLLWMLVYSSLAAVIVCVRLFCRSLSQTIGLRRRPIQSLTFLFFKHTRVSRYPDSDRRGLIILFFFPFIISTGNFSIGGKTAQLRDPKVSDGVYRKELVLINIGLRYDVFFQAGSAGLEEEWHFFFQFPREFTNLWRHRIFSTPLDYAHLLKIYHPILLAGGGQPLLSSITTPLQRQNFSLLCYTDPLTPGVANFFSLFSLKKKKNGLNMMKFKTGGRYGKQERSQLRSIQFR